MSQELENLIDAEMINVDRALATPQPTNPIDQQIQSEIDKELQSEMYGTPSQKALGFAEAVGRGLVSGPIATGIEKAIGVPAENISARKEELGGLGEFLGEGVGMILPTALTAGASSLARAGLAPLSLADKAKKLAQFSQAGMLNAAGQMAAKQAVTEAGKKALALGLESALYSTGDEITKSMISDHPSASMERLQSAAANIGASALFGGVLGYGISKASPLWQAKFGPQTQAELETIEKQIATTPEDLVKISEDAVPEINRKDILKGLTELKPNAKEIELSGEILGAPTPEGMLSNSKLIQKTESSLTKSSSVIGELRNKLYQKGFDAVDNSLVNVLKTDLPEDISKAELGTLLAESLDPKIRVTKDLTNKLYDVIAKETSFIPADKSLIQKLANEIMESKIVKANKRSPTYTVTKGLVEDLLEQNTVDELRAVVSDIETRFAGNYKLKSLGYELKDKLNNLIEKNIKGYAKQMAVPDPQARKAIMGLLNDLDKTNKIYGPFRNKITQLAEGLGFKGVTGPGDFLVRLREAKPESLVNRIYDPKNAKNIEFFAKTFPDEFKLVSDFQKRELLKSVTKRDKLKTTTLIDKILGMPKELRNAMFSKEDLKIVNAAKTWMNALPENVNISNTSQGIQFNEYWQSPLKAAQITAADAGKLAMIKFLKSGAPPSAAGFKVMGDYIVSAQAGLNLLTKAAANLIQGKDPYPLSFDPKEKALNQLDKRAMQLGINPESMVDVSNDLGYYMPQESTAMAATLSRITSYINSVRPTAKAGGILGKPVPPNQAQIAEYKKTLQIAEQPLVVLKKIHNGNLTSKDVKDLNAMYPELRNILMERLTKEIVEAKSQNKEIPFRLRKSLSLFTGMPLDSTFQPQAIQSAQATYQPQQMPQAQLPQMAKKSSRISKLPTLTETDQQRRMLNK